MTCHSRTIRTGGRSALRADSLIRTALLAQLANPRGTVWVVSGWISDVDILDNTDGAYDYLLGEDPPDRCRLSDLLLMIAHGGADSVVRIVTRPHAANQIFLDRIRHARSKAAPVHVHTDPDVHEKTLCGPDWMFTGSMNFTWNGLANNKEQITYSTDPAQVAQAQKEFDDEWGALL